MRKGIKVDNIGQEKMVELLLPKHKQPMTNNQAAKPEERHFDIRILFNFDAIQEMLNCPGYFKHLVPNQIVLKLFKNTVIFQDHDIQYLLIFFSINWRVSICVVFVEVLYLVN